MEPGASPSAAWSLLTIGRWPAAALSAARNRADVVQTIGTSLTVFLMTAVQGVLLAQLLGPEARGEYSAVVRGGWTDSQSGVAPKKQARMVQEGSVLHASELRGRAVDVAPEGFPHPVYRAGFALAIPAPPEPVLRVPQQPEVKVQESPAIAMENEGGPAAEPELEPLPETVQPESQPEPEARMENEGAPPEEPAPAPSEEPQSEEPRSEEPQ